MQMYISGEWVDSPTVKEVRTPYNGEVADTVPEATEAQIDQALAASVRGAEAMAKLTGYERSQILNKAADLLEEQVEDFAKAVSLEVGKPMWEARIEAGRMPGLLRLSAFEGCHQRGETLPIDTHVGSAGKFGMTIRVPCGVVVAIAPFNYPFLLALHKVGPALAVGNSVILKPASQTPLSALKFTKLMLEAGLPEHGLQCITGPGSRLGDALCSDQRVRKISFTGSGDVGEQIAKVAGVKRLSLELGSNSPLVILPDADMDKVGDLTAIGGFVNSGQVCASVQRILVMKNAYGDFLDALKPKIEALKIGPPEEDDTKICAMISEGEAVRVGEWVNEAVGAGAKLLTGGGRNGATFEPTILADVDPDMKVSRDELFGPVVAVTSVDSVDEAIALSNDTTFGLSAGIFTQDINSALRFAQEVEAGNIMINWSSLWRADLMPFGGLKMSGVGKEGPRYAAQEMTETKTVIFHGLQ